jgi:fatty-acyl-CoA synthase
MTNIYEQDLDQVAANYEPLTPISFLERSAAVYPDKIAIIHGELRYTYREFYERARRLAGALTARGIGVGDTVSIMAPNVPAMLEAHFGVPMTGAVLNALNFRLDADSIRFILEHGESKVLITDREYSDTIAKALEGMQGKPYVIDIDDPEFDGGVLLGDTDYEQFIAAADSEASYLHPRDEWQAISLCYTSGTTGNPKGVVLHHRGAYLNAMGQLLVFGVNPDSTYLWTLPMFHCNGWTYTWGVTAAGGTHVCLRRVDPALIFLMIKTHRVTHMCGAPIVLTMLIHAPEDVKISFEQTVQVATGGAAPPSQVIQNMEEMGFKVTHLYGLTETYGPATVCAWQDSWDTLDTGEQTAMMARQGVRYHTLENVMVADPETLERQPRDGNTMGEMMIRGNTVMKGYLKNPAASAEAFRGGWFHSGDLGVQHPNGYVEIKDRSKDVIISGGENISSLEIEEVLYKHSQVMEAAVVARPDEKWGETPCAFVTLKPDSSDVTAAEIISWCRERMAHFKAPRHVVFAELPKTSTGKIQKFALRERTAKM